MGNSVVSDLNHPAKVPVILDKLHRARRPGHDLPRAAHHAVKMVYANGKRRSGLSARLESTTRAPIP